jgi:GT2 family glycosyltransferase
MEMKILLAITTYNQLNYTKIFFDHFDKIKNSNVDVLIIDDCSTDETVKWCNENNVKVITKDSGKGLTHSWNLAYQYFKEHKEYQLLIISNNDIIIPNDSLQELRNCHMKWNSICIVPITTSKGCGHNEHQNIVHYYGDVDQSVDAIEDTQQRILAYRDSDEMRNRRFFFDPFRMLMFSGFFFSLKRDIIKYERTDGLLFNPELLNYKNEDDFNWNILIPNDEYPMLCKTSYVYHFKGKSFAHIKDARTDDFETFIKNR